MLSRDVAVVNYINTRQVHCRKRSNFKVLSLYIYIIKQHVLAFEYTFVYVLYTSMIIIYISLFVDANMGIKYVF